MKAWYESEIDRMKASAAAMTWEHDDIRYRLETDAQAEISRLKTSAEATAAEFESNRLELRS
jgi:hypothetical protein